VRRTLTLGRHRGVPRIYLQGAWLLDEGWQPGSRVQIDLGAGILTITPATCGCGDRRSRGCSCRRISSKRGGQVAVLDLELEALEEALLGAERLELRSRHGVLEVTPARSERLRRARVRNGLEGSLFSGAGLLTQAAQQAGLTPAWAVEVDEDYAEAYRRNHPSAEVWCCPIHEVDPAELPQVELLTAGIPCSPYSRKRRGRGQERHPEEHALGDMTAWTLLAIERVNPWHVVLEEVPEYLESASWVILRSVLCRLGYQVDARVLDSADYGSVAGRRRAVIVATTDDQVTWPEPVRCAHTLGDLLDAEVPEEAWFDRGSRRWLFDHWDSQRAAGRGFVSSVLTERTARVPAITRGYYKGQGDGAVLAHPEREGVYRWLTLSEGRRLHGLPEGYVLDAFGRHNRSGETLGQGVVVTLFEQLIYSVTRANGPVPVGGFE